MISSPAAPAFLDRVDAGRQLGACAREREWTNPLVLGLARGGVPVAREVAAAVGAPLDVAVARKIAVPGRPELGVGAVTADGPARYDDHGLARMGLTREDLRADCERERAEARRRLRLYRDGRPPLPVAGRDVLLVDDGLATGVTARAALGELRAARPRWLVFAAPVCARRPVAGLYAEEAADEVLWVLAPTVLDAVSRWYLDFAQTRDDEVLGALREGIRSGR